MTERTSEPNSPPVMTETPGKQRDREVVAAALHRCSAFVADQQHLDAVVDAVLEALDVPDLRRQVVYWRGQAQDAREAWRAEVADQVVRVAELEAEKERLERHSAMWAGEARTNAKRVVELEDAIRGLGKVMDGLRAEIDRLRGPRSALYDVMYRDNARLAAERDALRATVDLVREMVRSLKPEEISPYAERWLMDALDKGEGGDQE